MKKVIVIVGPTAVGKTKLSIELAKALNGEIINADSTQVYKYLNIATAKATPEEQEGIPHHLLDIKELEEDYTVYDFQRDVRKKIDEITSRNHLPILVGGTGFYIKAALYDYEFDEEEEKIDYSSYTNAELFELLKAKDPATAIHPNNRKRVERALTYIKNHQKPYSEKEKTSKCLYDVSWIGLTTDRKVLYDRINKRVDVMMEHGLLEEAKSIYDTGIRTKAVMTPIGYKELFPYFEGNCTLEESLDLIKQRSRKYAKRQYTWFNNQMNITWYSVNFDHFEKTIHQVLNEIKISKK